MVYLASLDNSGTILSILGNRVSESMIQLAGMMWQICLLRNNQSNLPYSYILLAALVLSSAVFQFILLDTYILQEESATLGLRILSSIAVMVATLSMIMRFNKCSNRMHKTLLGLFGTDLLFSCMRLLVAFVLPLPAANPLLFVLYFWELVVRGHILRCGVGTTLGKGILLAIFIQLVEEIPLVMGMQLPIQE